MRSKLLPLDKLLIAELVKLGLKYFRTLTKIEPEIWKVSKYAQVLVLYGITAILPELSLIDDLLFM